MAGDCGEAKVGEEHGGANECWKFIVRVAPPTGSQATLHSYLYLAEGYSYYR